MPYKSIQGPLVLSLALAALVAGASGAPQLDDVRKQAAQPLRSQSASVASHTAASVAQADRLRFEQALAIRGESASAVLPQAPRDPGIDAKLAPIERDLARLRRYEPLAASDVVTNSVDGADSTIALRGSIGNGDALSYSLSVAPRHGRVTIEDGHATYRPDPDFVGVDTYTYRVHAGQDSAEAVVAVTSIRERSLPATAAAAL